MKFETHGYHFLFDQTALSPGNLAPHHAPLKTVTKKKIAFYSLTETLLDTR